MSADNLNQTYKGNGFDETTKKLEALREKLLLGEQSPLVENFELEVFLAELHEEYTQSKGEGACDK